MSRPSRVALVVGLVTLTVLAALTTGVVSGVAVDSTPATIGADVTLSDGGYVELRADTVRGVSSYLDPGTHRRVSIPVEPLPPSIRSLTAVAVVGTPDRHLGPYTSNGSAVTAVVHLPTEPTATVTNTATATPPPTTPQTPRTATATPTPIPRSTTTDASGPGFGPVATVVVLCYLHCRRRLQ